MERPRFIQWGVPEAPASRHPVRDTLLVYGGLATVIVLFSWLTGGPVAKAIVVAALFLVVASVWNWFTFRRRSRRDLPD